MTSTAGKTSDRVRTERTQVTVSDFEREIERLEAGVESVNIMIHGDSNVGKTRVAGTCPGKTFWLVGEPGYKSAARAGARGGTYCRLHLCLLRINFPDNTLRVRKVR